MILSGLIIVVAKYLFQKNRNLFQVLQLNLKKGDTITLRTSMSNNNIKQVKSPKKITKGALVSFRINDKLEYYKIKKIESQKPIFYQ